MARKNRKRKSKYVLSTITEKRLDKYADFSLDDTIKNIICDAGIQTALLKEVIPETMGTDQTKHRHIFLILKNVFHSKYPK